LRQLGTTDATILIGIDQLELLPHTPQGAGFAATQRAITVTVGITKAISDVAGTSRLRCCGGLQAGQ
jgi:hypothetical protein